MKWNTWLFSGFQTEEEVANLAKVKSGYYPPGSPLRLITPSPSPVVVGSPHPPDRSEEDKEVETTMQTNQTGSSVSQLLLCQSSVWHGWIPHRLFTWFDLISFVQLKRTNSMKKDDDAEVLDACHDEENQACGVGGIRFPDSRAMDQFRRRVNRLRFHSQCQPDTQPVIQLANIGKSLYVRWPGWHARP